ncbi:MAG: bifunctional 4-hydroxy-2-oxoglutarate aldolase/2-dehydro-3-deoxy-phosphogluconate aldolase [Anaerolineaceae bacterium]|nr:bifunctional 4-hydroxy-2-oxoglutarate aldolase/2-dehydro-3-deoxy-phosphogluconate aldolase [Anaerolineaceae bacterium]
MRTPKEWIYDCGIIPVVVLSKVEDASPTAEALLKGGVDVMEITLRTSAGPDSIREVSKNCPEMLVGAGTVLNINDCEACVEAGAKFIVSPGFDKELVNFCLEHDILVIPGCVTPTEIMQSLNLGLDLIKFFPANIYGGLAALKALSGPFPNVKFIPTGGIDQFNLKEYLDLPNVYAVGGSWICNKTDIRNHEFNKIMQLASQSRSTLLGFELAHVGINCSNEEEALKSARKLNEIFGMQVEDGNSSCYAGKGIEFIKSKFLGAHGHLAVRTNDIVRAIVYLKSRGYLMDENNIKTQQGKIIAAYLQEQVSGFAIHLQQK